MNTMTFDLDTDFLFLWTTCHKSFYHNQPLRFEVHSNNLIPMTRGETPPNDNGDKQCYMYWGDDWKMGSAELLLASRMLIIEGHDVWILWDKYSGEVDDESIITDVCCILTTYHKE